jgi:hypothetical protein
MSTADILMRARMALSFSAVQPSGSHPAGGRRFADLHEDLFDGQERRTMQTGVIRRREGCCVLGRWCADPGSIVVETNDPAIQSVSDQILHTPQRLPIHGAECWGFATCGESLTEAPSAIRYLALFALEFEQRGFVLEPDEG